MSDALGQALDEAVAVVSAVNDVKGVIVITFIDDRSCTSGTSVAMHFVGQIPCPEVAGRLLEALLTDCQKDAQS